MQTSPSTTEQINNLIEFRQAVYAYGLTKARDAQIEVIDSLLCNQRVNSFVELSLAPMFRRGWASAYAAIEEGEQDADWLHRHVARQPPRMGDQVFALDTTLFLTTQRMVPYPMTKTPRSILHVSGLLFI